MTRVRVGTATLASRNPLTDARIRLPDGRVVTIEDSCSAVYGQHRPTLRRVAGVLAMWDGHLGYAPMPGQRAYEAAQWIVTVLGGQTISAPPPPVPPVDPNAVY